MTKDKGRMKEIEEMIEVVLLAIPREISAREFYLSAAKKSTSDASRDLFLDLANQEKGHEAELKKILEDLQNELSEMKKH